MNLGSLGTDLVLTSHSFAFFGNAFLDPQKRGDAESKKLSVLLLRYVSIAC